MTAQAVTKQTQKNWWIDAALFSSAVIAALSGIYFLFLPSGGFQGGRNPFNGVQILFALDTWHDLHDWSGLAMIVAAAIHLAIHWPWVVSMTCRIWNELTGKSGRMNAHCRWNVILDGVVAASFTLTALSGMYFLFFPGGRGALDPMILFARATWDWIHTWAGAVLVASAVIHLALHWKWVSKVTIKMARMALPAHSIPRPAAIAN